MDGSSDRPTIHVAEEIGPAAGSLLVAAVRRIQGELGRCRLGLSGGETPVPIYRWLARAMPATAYESLLVTVVDERHTSLPVPVDEGPDLGWDRLPPESNLRSVFEHWLAGTPFKRGNAIPMSTGRPLAEDLERFRRSFAARFASRLDAVLLGVGTDGHVASLFPGHGALGAEGSCVAMTDGPKPPAERITLSLSVLDAAPFVVLAAAGAEKGKVLGAARAGVGVSPLSRLAPGGEYHWVLDRAAADEMDRVLARRA